jgi:hypothetical protein
MGKLICFDLKEMFCMVLVDEEGWETTLEVKNKNNMRINCDFDTLQFMSIKCRLYFNPSHQIIIF